MQIYKLKYIQLLPINKTECWKFFWHRQHLFKKVDGGMEIKDIVHYSIPLGIPGKIMNNLIINKKLEKIFKFRKEYLDNRFKIKQRIN